MNRPATQLQHHICVLCSSGDHEILIHYKAGMLLYPEDENWQVVEGLCPLWKALLRGDCLIQQNFNFWQNGN